PKHADLRNFRRYLRVSAAWQSKSSGSEDRDKLSPVHFNLAPFAANLALRLSRRHTSIEPETDEHGATRGLFRVIRVDIAMSALSSAIHHIGHYHGGNESADQGPGLTA